MLRFILAAGVTMSAGAGLTGEKQQHVRPGSFVFFSGGAPAIEIRTNPGDAACPFEIRKPTASRRSKAIFAAY